mmetsp:Transcript_9630/g.27566  ORF Transcript_9630/g.27566 Transcript_9630/m.27566 type:complete len:82 (-) Transcript_9630:300-545(-)
MASLDVFFSDPSLGSFPLSCPPGPPVAAASTAGGGCHLHTSGRTAHLREEGLPGLQEPASTLPLTPRGNGAVSMMEFVTGS